MSQPLPQHDASRDFDFLYGRWIVHHRRLRERLAGSQTWDEFEGRAEAEVLPAGLGNRDELTFDDGGPVVGLSFRFFEPATQRWSIYWIDSRHRKLDPPVRGGFTGDCGTFHGEDVLAGRPIQFRFIWSRTATAHPRWEQAFSADAGRTWETNWVMDFSRPEDGR